MDEVRIEIRSISVFIGVEIIKRIPTPAHDPIKFLKVEHSVSISISLLHHFLEFLVRDLLSDFDGDPLQVLKCDLIEVVFIEEFEHFENLLFRISRTLI